MLTNLALLLIAISGTNHSNISAQLEDIAQQSIPVIVYYEGVSIRLSGAQNAPSLPVNALSLIARGDSIHTDEQGRALLVLADATYLLLLPNSRLILHDYRLDAEGIIFEASVQGVAVQTTQDAFASYQLHLDVGRVVDAGALFGVWSTLEDNVVVTSAIGQTSVVLEDEIFVIASGEGGRVRDNVMDIAIINAPYNAARLIGQLDGCEAVVVTSESTGLLIRRGAGRGFERMNLTMDGETVRVMAQTESGTWSRVQFLNGFGWMQSLALSIEDGCADLRRLPDETLERNDIRVINLREEERTLLIPFFGSPTVDIWFYRFDE